ncbi:hypothetical protein BRADI_1g31737v3 [Brachypodium distachyon]|uniref:tRNA pseudouridine synthase n=1 Tax=Brachypodium distachyon TaxID=15368 RepID=A0A0Q3JGL1_BRADI|nr:hypothetical protein BRADI_1g31737v3 [Brachypodium distachyon]
MLAKFRPLMATAAKAKPPSALSVSTAAERDEYPQYNHTDACRHLRWTAKESYEYMHARPWSRVVDFYAMLVRTGAGTAGLAEMFRKDEKDHISGTDGEDFETSSEKQMAVASSKARGGRWERLNFKIVLSYHGGSFDGWQKQPDLNTVQGLVEKHLGQFVDERKAKQLQERSLPIEGCATVAGRTDKGVSRQFHPNFSAKWRKYLYIFPLDQDAEPISGKELSSIILENPEYNVTCRSFDVAKVDKIIRKLEGKLLSYKIFARDTQASRMAQLRSVLCSILELQFRNYILLMRISKKALRSCASS